MARPPARGWHWPHAGWRGLCWNGPGLGSGDTHNQIAAF